MKKQILLTSFLVLAVMFSLSAISASDVNIADSDNIDLANDTAQISVPANLDYSSKGSTSGGNLLSVAADTDSLNDNDNAIMGQSIDEIYGANNNDSSTVKLEDTIKASDVTKYYKASTKYTATFTDNNGNALANTPVKIIVNNVTKNVTTNAKGVASLNVNLQPGTYKIIATNPSTNYQLTTNFKILTTIKANDITKVYADSKEFVATFLKSNGKPLAKKNIKFTIGGKSYTVKTDSKGVAKLSLTKLKSGSYKIVSYNNDGLTKVNNVTVLKYTTSKFQASDYLFTKKQTKKIKARLLNGLGYGIPGKVVKITINGKTYSKKTNSKGYVYLTLPKLNTGIFSVKYNFKGNSVYKSSAASKKVTVVLSKTKKLVEISSITSGAKKVYNTFLTKGIILDTVSTGGYKFTIHEFYYLMSKAIVQLGNSKTSHITAISNVKGPQSKCSDGVYAAAVTKSKYKAIAKNSVNYIVKNKRVPNYFNAVAGKIAFEDYVAISSRVLNYYHGHKELPNFASFVSPHKPNYKYFNASNKDNPYGLNGKKVWIDADGGSDAIKWELAKALKKLGWEVHVGDTYANAHYEDYFNTHPGYVLINIYNGFCAGTIRELASNSIQDLLKTKNVVCVPVFHTAGWTNPNGMKPYRYGDFSKYSAKKAWDDDFSVTDPSIKNVGQFLKTNNIKYCASPTCDLIVKQFLKGGYFASVA